MPPVALEKGFAFAELLYISSQQPPVKSGSALGTLHLAKLDNHVVQSYAVDAR